MTNHNSLEKALKEAERKSRNKLKKTGTISEVDMLMADDDWHAFFSASDPDDLRWLRYVVKIIKTLEQSERKITIRPARGKPLCSK